MSAPLPSALRARFQRYMEEGLSGRAAALRLRLSPATGVRRGRAIRTKGHVEPLPRGRPKGHGKLAPHRALPEKPVRQDPDITLFELGDALAAAEGVRIHHAPIASLLSRLGCTCKKVAGGRRTPRCQGQTAANRLVYTSLARHRGSAGTRGFHARTAGPRSETPVKTNLTRLRGRALRGTCLAMDAPFGSWGHGP